MTLIARSEIEKLVPQRNPILMVHELVVQEETKSVSRFTVEEDNLFLKDGKMQAPGLMENIAQTAAARAGYVSYSTNEPPKIGFIPSSRVVCDLTISRPPTNSASSLIHHIA